MNINELLQELTNRNISLSGRAISKIWGMDETSFSKKKKSGTQIKQKNIMQLEDVLGIKLVKQKEKKDKNINSLERQYDKDIKLKRKNLGKRILKLKNVNHLSDFQMAGLLCVPLDVLNDIILEKTQINLDILDNIKQNFKVSSDWLLYGEEKF